MSHVLGCVSHGAVVCFPLCLTGGERGPISEFLAKNRIWQPEAVIVNSKPHFVEC